MDVKNLYREKFEDELPSHLVHYNNHSNYSFSNSTEDWIMLDRYCEENNINFLGITKAPYNPYGKEFEYAVVFEDINNDYEVFWYHTSKRWIEKMRKSLE